MAGPFDLEQFAPDRYFEFKLLSGGDTYRVFADPDVDQVARMLRVEQAMVSAMTNEALADAISDAKKLLVELLQDADPGHDFGGFGIGVRELKAVFAGIMHGESVAQAVLEGIAAESLDAPPEGETGDSGALQPDDSEASAAGEGDVAPLRSEKPLPGRSSSSDEPAGSLLATGTG